MERRFSPREFLKTRRPERFSDSNPEDEPVLNRTMMEYHLETLTSRSQEAEFQRFAFELAKREICPNLLPQTGPTGGGDSKVDSETYPVADSLSLVWHVGIGREASTERWGFAISAKADWLPKLKSDIAKIAGTGRGYTKAFFITNQFVKDKTRADIEDNLRTKHGLDVRILSRSWILDRVFEGHHESLAIEHLGLATSFSRQVKQGPLDLERQRELEQVEARVKAASHEGRFGFDFVEDCIEAPILARGMERPRAEVEGLFLRAERVAKDHGTQHQQLKAAYDRAWTVFWWYEDYKSFAELYDAVESLAKGSQNAYDLELLNNLWVCLHSMVRTGEIAETDTKLQSRTELLATELDRLSKEEDRQSAMLQARTQRLHMRLQSAISTGGDIDPILRDFQEVVIQCGGLVGYPLEPLVDFVTELGRLIGERPAYDQLFETVTEIASRRKGEVASGRMLAIRGVQQLDADRPYDAIRSLGRALGRLFKHESRKDVVRALYCCGCAYEQVGLLWAARGSMLTAASVAMNDFWSYGDVTGLQGACCDELKWLELQLGRVPHALAWHEIDQIIKPRLLKEGMDGKRLADREMQFDVILGMLLLKANLSQLEQLTSLPDILEQLGLLLAADALRFALGHKIELPFEVITTGAGYTTPDQFFGRWRDQPAFEDLPEIPALYADQTVTLRSTLLGCRISVVSENTSPCVELGESALAALESLFATGFVDGIAAREPVLSVSIRKSESADEPFDFEMHEQSGRPHVEIRCHDFDPKGMTVDAQQRIRDKLFELLAHILPHVFFVSDFDSVLSKLFRDDRAVDRSVCFASTFVTLGNVLGHSPKTHLADWSDPNVRNFALLRPVVWDAAERAALQAGGILLGLRSEKVEDVSGAERLDFGRAKHTQMETVSLIREPLWNRAGWSGTLFVGDENDSRPPALGLLFKQPQPAAEIFAQWREELGSEDTNENLRVALIRGINTNEPHWYRVIITTNPNAATAAGNRKLIFGVSRIQTMEAVSGQNLERFLRSYNQVGAYYLIHGITQGESTTADPVWDNCILKKQLFVRHAWEIGRNDPDLAGIQAEDDPIIPTGCANAPVLEALKWLRDRTNDVKQAGFMTQLMAAHSPHEMSAKARAERRKAIRKPEKRAAKRKKKR